MSTLATLPDSHVLWSKETGPVTIGEVRAEQKPALDEFEATCQMYEDLATRNLCRPPCQPAVSHSAVRAYHVSRYMSALTARGSN